MEVTYRQTEAYQIFCNEKGYVAGCNIVTTTDFYGDKVYMSTSSASKKISLREMKKIVSELKE